MKRTIKTIVFSLVAAALVTLPVVSNAQDTNTPAATAPAKSKKPNFHGKATAVDAAAMTVTVDTKVIYVTSDTKITKNGKPAVLSDIVVGDTVGGSYTKGDDGKMNAVTLHDGVKAKKKKAADDSASPSTNAPAN